MMEFFRSADREALKEKWETVAFGPGPPDWDNVFRGYGATVDWPSSAYYRELADHYPAAKVILTVRDPERWYDSAAGTIFSGPTSAEELAKRTDNWGRIVKKVVAEGVFGGTIDRAHAIGVFRRHVEEVTRTIPPERLLVYEVGEGWEPLCRFLGVPAPDAPFPRENTTEKFQAGRNADKAAEAEDKGAG
jgi:hypothetical protein